MRLDHLLSKEQMPDEESGGASKVRSRDSECCSILKALFKSFQKKHGGVAQLGERLPCTQEVESSNLFISTRGRPRDSKWAHSSVG